MCWRIFVIASFALLGSFGSANAMGKEFGEFNSTFFWLGGSIGAVAGIAIASLISGHKSQTLHSNADDTRAPLDTQCASIERVDMSEMETAIGREVVARLNSEYESNEMKNGFFVRVLKEFRSFEHFYQLELTRSAYAWSMASLASHSRCDNCEKYFEAIIESMYALCEATEKSRTESQLKQLIARSQAVKDRLFADVGEILGDSGERLARLDEMDPRRITGQALHRLFMTFLDHASPNDFPQLIAACSAMCSALACERAGVEIDGMKLVQAMMAVCDYANEISKTVMGDVKSGRLVVVNGKIINPA